jgi:hypothetical protein
VRAELPLCCKACSSHLRVRRQRLFAIVLGKRRKEVLGFRDFLSQHRPAKVLARGSSPALPRSCLPCKANHQA